jgi:cytochrome c oxidase assembly factor 6
MGLFSSSSTPSTPLPPNRASRSTCWAARDEFFACLDQNGIIDSIKNAEEADKCCGKLERTFQKDCAASWVSSSPVGFEKDKGKMEDEDSSFQHNTNTPLQFQFSYPRQIKPVSEPVPECQTADSIATRSPTLSSGVSWKRKKQP